MCKSKFRCQEVVAHSIVSSMCWCCGMGEVDKCAVPIPKCKVEKLEKIEWTFILFSEGFVFKVSTAISLLIPIKTSSHETIVLEPKKTSTWFFWTQVFTRNTKGWVFSREKLRFWEAIKINQSLSALGDVIAARVWGPWTTTAWPVEISDIHARPRHRKTRIRHTGIQSSRTSSRCMRTSVWRKFSFEEWIFFDREICIWLFCCLL